MSPQYRRPNYVELDKYDQPVLDIQGADIDEENLEQAQPRITPKQIELRQKIFPHRVSPFSIFKVFAWLITSFVTLLVAAILFSLTTLKLEQETNQTVSLLILVSIFCLVFATFYLALAGIQFLFEHFRNP